MIIRIISEQRDFYVLYKPSGMDFHTDKGEPGFFRQVQLLLPEESLFPVHRLDKMTSGLILAARSPEAAAGLGQLLLQRRMEKFYLAVSDRKPVKKQGLVKGDMVRSRRGGWKLTRGSSDPAVTYFYSRSLQPGRRLFLLKIYTGKTHQIRVAMKSLGAPVLGDRIYNLSGSDVDRGYLHAWQIGFSWNGQDLVFRCDPEEGLVFREGFVFPREWERPEDLNWPVF